MTATNCDPITPELRLERGFARDETRRRFDWNELK